MISGEGMVEPQLMGPTGRHPFPRLCNYLAFPPWFYFTHWLITVCSQRLCALLWVLKAGSWVQSPKALKCGYWWDLVSALVVSIRWIMYQLYWQHHFYHKVQCLVFPLPSAGCGAGGRVSRGPMLNLPTQPAPLACFFLSLWVPGLINLGQLV